MIVNARRRRSEIQVLVLGAPIGYAPPLGEVHTEYPKFINLSKLRTVIVNNEAEEAAVLEGVDLKPREAVIINNVAPVPTLQGRNNEREMLVTVARSRGIPIQDQWTTRKLRKVVERACTDHSERQSWP